MNIISYALKNKFLFKQVFIYFCQYYLFYIFNDRDGKDKVFHITVSSKKIQNIFPKLWDYVNKIPCEFECSFDNICIYKWEDNTWKLHKEYLLKKS